MSLTWEVVEMFEVQTYNGSLVVQSCISCGTMFGVERGLENQLRLTHRNFYCPNGHPMVYQAKTEAEKLRDQLAGMQSRLDQNYAALTDAQKDAEHERNRVRGLQGAITKAKKRAAAGVCPCCTRSFQNVSRHMKNQHPDYAATTLEPTPEQPKSKPKKRSKQS